jgi:hypothetical protein
MEVRVGRIDERIDEDFTEAHPVRPNDRQLFGKRPVIVSDWISGKNGQLIIHVKTDEDWFAIQALLHTPRTLLLQFPRGGQRFVRLTSRSWPNEPIAGPEGTMIFLRKIVVDFAEAARPVVTE